MATRIAPAASPEKLSPRPVRTFFDSNILLYAEDAAFPVKQQKAVELIVHHRRHRTGVISLQVLGEFFEVATRKLKIDPAIVRIRAEFYARFDLVEPALTDVFAATDLHRLHHYSYWDSLVLRCALSSGCKVLLSEDMQHGRVIDGLRIENPFV